MLNSVKTFVSDVQILCIYGKHNREKYNKKNVFNFAKLKHVLWQVLSILSQKFD